MTGKRKIPDHPDEYRMTIGEHLDELRGCLIRSILAMVVAALACIYPVKWLFAVICRPVALALKRHNQDPTLLQTAPVELFVIIIKVVVIAGLVISSPYILHQLWGFVAAGLYPHERKWVKRMIWPSAALFLVGVMFMYFLVLPLSLDFLIGIGGFLPLPDITPTALESKLLGDAAESAPATQPAPASLPSIPVTGADPPDPESGNVWFNQPQGKLKIKMGEEVWSLLLKRDDHRSMIDTRLKIGEYLSFFLILTIAFGLAFQLPLVVIFLARTGIMPVEAMRRNRRIVILIIVVIAAMLAPPDLLSHLLLSGPMILLFELGVFIAARQDKAPRASTQP